MSVTLVTHVLTMMETWCKVSRFTDTIEHIIFLQNVSGIVFNQVLQSKIEVLVIQLPVTVCTGIPGISSPISLVVGFLTGFQTRWFLHL